MEACRLTVEGWMKCRGARCLHDADAALLRPTPASVRMWRGRAGLGGRPLSIAKRRPTTQGARAHAPQFSPRPRARQPWTVQRLGRREIKARISAISFDSADARSLAMTSRDSASAVDFATVKKTTRVKISNTTEK